MLHTDVFILNPGRSRRDFLFLGMLRFIFLLLLLASSAIGKAQLSCDSTHRTITTLQPEKEYDNILVKNICNDSLSSSFVIWIKNEVKLHRHDAHTETVYILEGEGRMQLGDAVFNVHPGSLITIPKGTPHAVKVTSATPMKVLSVQSPFYDGKDRIVLQP